MTSLPEARPHPTRVSRLPGSVNVVAHNPKLRSCWRLQGLTSASTAPTVRLFSSSAGQDIAIGSAQEHVSGVCHVGQVKGVSGPGPAPREPAKPLKTCAPLWSRLAPLTSK